VNFPARLHKNSKGRRTFSRRALGNLHDLLCKVDELEVTAIRMGQGTDDRGLSGGCHLAIADKGRQDLFVPQVLAPRLELLWSPAQPPALVVPTSFESCAG
jgi:hypothetical protein